MISLTFYAGAILALAFYLLKTMPNAKEEINTEDSEVLNEPATLAAERGDYDHLFNTEGDF